MKTCISCHIELNEQNTYLRSNGSLRDRCKTCYNKRVSVRKKTPQGKQKAVEQRKRFRQNPKNLPSIILKDSKNSDKKKGRENDLTKEFIEKTIVNGCKYCRETNIRITLDRIDNNLGHTQNNLNASCIRCNLVRGDMPYEAWLCLIDGMTEAREKGLFGLWIGKLKTRV